MDTFFELDGLIAEENETIPALSDGQVVAELRAGSRLNHYVVQQKIGSGGFGFVYKVFDTRRDVSVALKIFRKNHCKELYDRECEALWTVKHENIVSILGEGQFEDRRFLTMDYVEGVPLSQKIGGYVEPMNPLQSVNYAAKIALALVQVHSKGIIHYDVKPGNILINKDDEPILIDFGVCLFDDPEPAETDKISGTPAYMSPEQLTNEAKTFRTDIYSLGMTLYACLANKEPKWKNMKEKYGFRPQLPSSFNSGIDPSWDWAILRLLEFKAEARCPDAQTAHSLLVGILEDSKDVTACGSSSSIGEKVF